MFVLLLISQTTELLLFAKGVNRIVFYFKVKVNLKNPGKKLEHHGIKIELVGQIGKRCH